MKGRKEGRGVKVYLDWVHSDLTLLFLFLSCSCNSYNCSCGLLVALIVSLFLFSFHPIANSTVLASFIGNLNRKPHSIEEGKSKRDGYIHLGGNKRKRTKGG